MTMTLSKYSHLTPLVESFDWHYIRKKLKPKEKIMIHSSLMLSRKNNYHAHI